MTSEQANYEYNQRLQQQQREDYLRQQQWDHEAMLRNQASAAQTPVSSQPSQWEIQQYYDQQGARRDALNRVMGLFGSGGGGWSAPAAAQTVGSIGGGAGTAAAFARAKETAGRTARASMSALDDVMAERGLMGSSIAAAQTGALVGGAANQVNDFTREQAIQQSNQAQENARLQFQAQQQANLQASAQQANQRNALMSLIGQLY